MKEIRVGNDWAIVDDEDYERLMERNWYKNNKGYAYSPDKKNGTYTENLMHREIMQPEKGLEVHHSNHDTLDNRRQNLVICTHRENLQTLQKPQKKSGKEPSSAYKGVYRHKNGKFKVTLRSEGVQYHLGYFDDEDEAAKVYDAAAKHYHGAFAVLNFP